MRPLNTLQYCNFSFGIITKVHFYIFEFLFKAHKEEIVSLQTYFLLGHSKDFTRYLKRILEICKKMSPSPWSLKTTFSNSNRNGYLFLTNAVGILWFFFALTAGERGYFISIQKNRTLGTRGAESAVASSQILTGQETNKTFLWKGLELLLAPWSFRTSYGTV